MATDKSKEAMKLALDYLDGLTRALKMDDTAHAYQVTAALREALAEQPAQHEPLTDEMVVAAARVLSDRQAASCNVDCGDMWKLHGNDFIDDARAALEAAHGIKEKNNG